MKKGLLVFYFLIPFVLFAEWDPEKCFDDSKSKKAISRLNQDSYKTLKKKVKSYLKDSWCSEEKISLLMDLTMITRPSLCVEIGAHTGSTILPVASTLKYLNKGSIYAIDAWSNAVAIKNMDQDDPNWFWWSTVDMTKVFAQFKKMISDWSLSKNCLVINRPSEEASKRWPDLSIDFLHIDGDYTETGSLRDVELYFPKVKEGGYILLSNVNISIKDTLPKMKSFIFLFENCDLICEEENTALFRKPTKK